MGMKNIFKAGTLFGLLFVATSCEKDEEKAVLNAEAKIEMSLSANTLALDKEKGSETALSVSWETQQLNLNLGHSYSILLESNGKSKEVSVTKSPYSFSHVELNKILLANLELAAGTEAEVKVTLKDAVSSTYSIPTQAKTIKITPYADLIEPTEWGIVGHATPNGWDGPDLPFWKNPTNSNERIAYVALKDGEIKFRKNNAWAENYGDDGKNGSLENGGANIPVTAGIYKIVWNINENTYTIEKYSWSIIGDGAKGWGDNDDILLEYDGPTNTWKATGVTLKNGGIKFRFNKAWAVSWGDKNADGVLDQEDDNNIPVTAGTYTITVDFSVTPPTYSIK